MDPQTSGQVLYGGAFAYGMVLFFLSTSKLDDLKQNPNLNLVVSALLLPFVGVAWPLIEFHQGASATKIQSAAASGIMIAGIGYAFLFYRWFENKLEPGFSFQNVGRVLSGLIGVTVISGGVALVVTSLEGYSGAAFEEEFQSKFWITLGFSILLLCAIRGWFWVMIGQILKGASEAAEKSSEASRSSRTSSVRTPPTRAKASSVISSGTPAGTFSSSESDSEDSAAESKREKNTATYGKGHKLCATCSMWGGPRDLHPSRRHVIASSNSKGQCMGGGHDRHNTPANGRCNEYERWSALA